ncbi:MAG TPA: chemotaxis protein CheW, partial [Oligoflexia bacterium]|nr:chemotaxis protein CheW [Oligoflexia bacterium]
WISIRGDGRGLDRAKILAKAIERGLVSGDGSELSDTQVFRLIFEPGFSTAEKVTDISGRGVGMDVVKKNIEKIKGRVDIQSVPGKGASFILRIPLTLAIIEGMLVRVGDGRYIVPLLAIRESVHPEAGQITVTPEGAELIRVRDDFFPVVRIHRLFGKTPQYTELHQGIIILVDFEGKTIALFVDEILGQQETVIKGLSDYVAQARSISGCTILGDGEVSLILDIGGIAQAV